MRNFCDNEKVNKAINNAWSKLFTGNDKWFDTEEEAENFLGDCAFDFLYNVLEGLGIDCDNNENECGKCDSLFEDEEEDFDEEGYRLFWLG